MSDRGRPDRADIEADQLHRLRTLLAALVPGNRFYTPRLEAAGLTGDLPDLDTFRRRMPFTTKRELVEDQQRHPPYGTNLTHPPDRYTRLHQTSGTTGRPLRWLDTPESWAWMLDGWQRIYEAAGVGAGDRILFAFSFGPFIGFWIAFEAATRMGCLCLPAGGLSSVARLRMMRENRATVVCCTPTYALRLAEVAAEHGIELGGCGVRVLIVAGEPGGSVPATRRRIADAWGGAVVFDHHGMTEIGPATYQHPRRPGLLCLIELAFIAEVIDPQTAEPVRPGETGELVLTNLGRTGSPLLRYRTGDLVRPVYVDERGEPGPHLALDGGILARTDDMVLVRGVNVYPSAIDQIVRAHRQVTEYRVEIDQSGSLTQMALIVEPASNCEDAASLAAGLAADLRDALSLRVPVRIVEPNALPRFELKAERWIRKNAR